MHDAKVRLLIVDDELSIRNSLRQLFIQSGYCVRTAEEGFSALLQIREQVPDILVSDLNMTGMSGFELMSIVRRRFPAMKVIAMSGSSSGGGMSCGVAADAFYTKGSDSGLLSQIIRTLPQVPWSLPQYSTMSAPIWISRSGHDSSGRLHIIIICPECLRSFPMILEDGICHIHETDCVHCHGVIYYAIVQPVIDSSLQVPLGKFGEVKPHVPSACQYYY